MSMLLQRFGAILRNISGKKNADLEAFAVPLINNMEAIWAATLLQASSILDYQRRNCVWWAYFMALHAEKKDPGLNFRQNYTLMFKSRSVLPVPFKLCSCENSGFPGYCVIWRVHIAGNYVENIFATTESSRERGV